MTLRFFNTLTRQKQVFTPLIAKQVSLYACGPTVYHYAHLGNLRTYVFEDLLVRTLRHAGYTVNHVMNITDVGHLESDADEGDDKMAKASQREQKSPWEIARFYEDAFFKDTDRLHLIRPSLVCRATDHISDMIAFIQVLESKGMTYTVDGNVYFRLENFPTYADFSKQNLNALQEGARVEIDARKENPLDFVLWFSNSKFPNQIMKWDSPWGIGFPGWHIECSAMASKYLGERIDIHCGGIDHINVHHTNEIAQSEACFGHPWVNLWMHGEFLVLQKEKMSKSLGNFLTLDKIIEEGFDPLHYRYLCLSAHYRSQLLFSTDALIASRNAFEGLKNRVIAWKITPEKPKNSEKQKAYDERFWMAILDDLNLPVALSVVWEMAKDNALSNTEKLTLIKGFDNILGLGVESFTKPTLTDELMQLVNARETARAHKDWAKADQFREQLLQAGVQIKDTALGPDWYWVYKD